MVAMLCRSEVALEMSKNGEVFRCDRLLPKVAGLGGEVEGGAEGTFGASRAPGTAAERCRGWLTLGPERRVARARLHRARFFERGWRRGRARGRA